jgi:hypothetical protein
MDEWYYPEPFQTDEDGEIVFFSHCLDRGGLDKKRLCYDFFTPACNGSKRHSWMIFQAGTNDEWGTMLKHNHQRRLNGYAFVAPAIPSMWKDLSEAVTWAERWVAQKAVKTWIPRLEQQLATIPSGAVKEKERTEQMLEGMKHVVEVFNKARRLDAHLREQTPQEQPQEQPREQSQESDECDWEYNFVPKDY